MMHVRPADTPDAVTMAQVMAEVAEEGSLAAQPPVDVDAMSQKFRETVDSEDGAQIWVLEENQQILGHASMRETRATGVYSLGMAIRTAGRGRGGGRELVEAILNRAHTDGAHKVELEVWPDNARAIALYARCGFSVEGLRHNHYRRNDGTLRSALIMAIHLESG